MSEKKLLINKNGEDFPQYFNISGTARTRILRLNKLGIGTQLADTVRNVVEMGLDSIEKKYAIPQLTYNDLVKTENPSEA